MFAFSQIEPNRTGQMTRWDVPVDYWLRTRAQEGREYMAHTAISRMTEDFISEGSEVSSELANKQWGIPGQLEFSGSVNVQEAALKHGRKLREIELQDKLNMAGHSAASWKAVAGFGANMVGQVSSPLDFATMFLPFIGSSAKARAAAMAGRGVFRQALARGIITEELLANYIKYPRLSAAVIDGTLGNAVAELPVFIQKTRDQADYGPADALTNIAAGGIFAGALHLGFRGLQKAFDRITPEIKERIVQHEVDAFLKGETPESHLIARVDEEAIAAKVHEELQLEGEVEFPKVSGTLPQVSLAKSVIGAAELRRRADLLLEHGWVKDDIAPNQWGWPLVGRPKVGETQDGVALALAAVQTNNNVWDNPKWEEAVKHGPTLQDLDLAKELHSKIFNSPSVTQRVADERERRIREYIESRKPERIAAAKVAELQAQQAQGKILSQEQIQEFTLAPDERSLSVIDEDAKNIEASLTAAHEQRLKDESLTPEQREVMQEKFDKMMKEIEEKLPQDETRAIEQAKNCLLQNG